MAPTLLFLLCQVILYFTTKLVLIMPISFTSSAADFIHLLHCPFFKPRINRRTTTKIENSHKDLKYSNEFGPGHLFWPIMYLGTIWSLVKNHYDGYIKTVLDLELQKDPMDLQVGLLEVPQQWGVVFLHNENMQIKPCKISQDTVNEASKVLGTAELLGHASLPITLYSKSTIPNIIHLTASRCSPLQSFTNCHFPLVFIMALANLATSLTRLTKTRALRWMIPCLPNQSKLPEHEEVMQLWEQIFFFFF